MNLFTATEREVWKDRESYGCQRQRKIKLYHNLIKLSGFTRKAFNNFLGEEFHLHFNSDPDKYSSSCLWNFRLLVAAYRDHGVNGL